MITIIFLSVRLSITPRMIEFLVNFPLSPYCIRLTLRLQLIFLFLYWPCCLWIVVILVQLDYCIFKKNIFHTVQVSLKFCRQLNSVQKRLIIFYHILSLVILHHINHKGILPLTVSNDCSC